MMSKIIFSPEKLNFSLFVPSIWKLTQSSLSLLKDFGCILVLNSISFMFQQMVIIQLAYLNSHLSKYWVQLNFFFLVYFLVLYMFIFSNNCVSGFTVINYHDQNLLEIITWVVRPSISFVSFMSLLSILPTAISYFCLN